MLKIKLEKNQLLKASAVLMIAICTQFTTACSTVSVDKSSTSQTLVKQRGNIVTQSSLSDKTSSSLRSLGVTSDSCLSNFNECLEKVERGTLEKNGKESLALYAELYLAKAKNIESNEGCELQVQRPPIDPYYANAPLTTEEKAQRNKNLINCHTNYRNYLLNAIKYSFGYLFYNDLTPNNQDITSNNPNPKPYVLVSDLDIQTQDVYDDSTDLLIKQLYANRNLSLQIVNVTSYLSPELVSDAKNSMNGLIGANKVAYGEQVKILNFNFPPIPKNNSLSNSEESGKSDLNETNLIKTADKDSELNDEKENIKSSINKNENKLPISIDLFLPNEPEYLQNSQRFNKSIDKLYASHELTFSGLNTVSKREGFGVGYVTLFDDRLNTSVAGLLTSENEKLNSENPLDRIHLTGNLLLTSIIQPKGNTLEEVLSSNKFDINLYNPHHVETVEILGKPYYLAANFSASYGMWLAENRLGNVGYFNLLTRQQALTQPQLFMLEPYDPKKRIIIMLHGLASSPATWVSVTNDIINDEKLRNNYQVWQIFYPTNIPMLENRFRIQELIETAYNINDPNSKHVASQNSVLIGHSMGAVIGRMLVSNQNLEQKFKEISREESHRQLNKLLSSRLDELNVINRLHLNKLESVDTAVFISAPFRGTDFADRWFTQMLRRIVQLPLGFLQTIQGNLTSIATEGELVANPLGALFFENGASQLSDKSSFMKLTADLKIADNVTYHSIIANRDSDIFQGLLKLNITSQPDTELSDTDKLAPQLASIKSLSSDSKSLNKDIDSKDKPELPESLENVAESITPSVSDGIVPYNSSHLEGAASETILSGGHGIHETPEAVLTLRKILHNHLQNRPIEKN